MSEKVVRYNTAQIFIDGRWRRPNMDDPRERAVMLAYERALRRSMEKVPDGQRVAR